MATAQVRRTVASASMLTTWGACVTDGSFDLTLPASVGDTIEAGVSLGWSNGASFCWLDVAVMVGGSPARWLSTGTGTHGGGVLAMFQCSAPDFTLASGSEFCTVQAGDLVGGTVTLRLYGKSGVAGRTLSGENDIFWAATCESTPVSTALSGTITTGGTLLTGSVTLPASAGDVLCATMSGVLNPGGGFAPMDACTVNGSTPINFFTSGSSTFHGGAGGWRSVITGDYQPVGGSVYYTVQPGDIISGQVSVGVIGLTSAGTRPVDPASKLTVRKVILPFAQAKRTTAFPTNPGPTWVPLASDGTFDVTIPAAVGSVIEVGVSMISPGGVRYCWQEAAVMVGGSPVRWLAPGTAVQPEYGIGAWFRPAQSVFANQGLTGSVLYTAQPGDVVAGGVTFRLYAKSSVATATWVSTAADKPVFYAATRSVSTARRGWGIALN